MSVIETLIRSEADGSISFGNYELNTKSKLSDFEHDGDLYKIKTFYEITKLERNGMFVYESVPGTVAQHFQVTNEGVTFTVEGYKESLITVQLDEDCTYEVYVNGEPAGMMDTNMSGKLNLSLELKDGDPCELNIEKRQL